MIILVGTFKMADRKAELERKKARLHQMREEKERRRKEKERLDAELAAQSLVGARNGSTTPSINCKLTYPEGFLPFVNALPHRGHAICICFRLFPVQHNFAML